MVRIVYLTSSLRAGPNAMQGPHDARISRLSGNPIDIKAELESNLSANSDEQVGAEVGDLERGERELETLGVR